VLLVATTAAIDAPAPSPAFEPPPGNPRFPLFDGLRGIAVLAILAFHVLELTAQLGFGFWGRFAEVIGGEAVIVFFGISGFLLYRPYVAARARGRAVPSTRRYARNRALRILPGYWFALTVLAIFPGLVGVFTGDWWRFYGYLQLYSARTSLQGISVAWTLCVEVTFYIALPVWALAVRRWPSRDTAGGLLRAELLPLAIVAAGGWLVQLAAATGHVSPTVASTLVGQCSWLALGMTLAVISVATERDRRAVSWLRALAERPNVCWLLAAAAIGGLMAIVPSGGLLGLIATVQTRQPLHTAVLKIALEAVVVTTLLLPAVFADRRRGVPRRVLAARPIAYLGVISYSFYLFHLTIAELIALPSDHQSFSASGLGLMAHVHVAHTLILYVAALAATTVVASITYRFVELPFLRRK
jgi:peptidoglycan/LPS O-acetylase OafA/YrhL